MEDVLRQPDEDVALGLPIAPCRHEVENAFDPEYRLQRIDVAVGERAGNYRFLRGERLGCKSA